MQKEHGKDLRAIWKSALAPNPKAHEDWDGYAELCLFLGHEDEYREVRRELIAGFGKSNDPHIAERTGRACLLALGTEEEIQAAAILIDRALKADLSRLEPWAPAYFHVAQGLFLYRQGRWNESIAVLKGDANNVLLTMPRLVLAMAQF